jgi:RNA polymerase sigma-70 factor (ECF subfamily)
MIGTGALIEGEGVMEPSNQPLAGVSDADVVERVRRGEVQAYGTLVDRYERAVLAAVLPIVGDAHAAQDVVQDVFVRCFTRLGSLRDGSRFGPWLLKAAGREAIHASRRSKRMRIEPRSDADDGDLASPSDNERLLNDERERLLQCVRMLPAHERVAVSLRYFEGRGCQRDRPRHRAGGRNDHETTLAGHRTAPRAINEKERIMETENDQTTRALDDLARRYDDSRRSRPTSCDASRSM